MKIEQTGNDTNFVRVSEYVTTECQVHYQSAHQSYCCAYDDTNYKLIGTDMAEKLIGLAYTSRRPLLYRIHPDTDLRGVFSLLI